MQDCGVKKGDGKRSQLEMGLTLKLIWRFIFQLAAALACCHHGVVVKNINGIDKFELEPHWAAILHRDIRPYNSRSPSYS